MYIEYYVEYLWKTNMRAKKKMRLLLFYCIRKIKSIQNEEKRENHRKKKRKYNRKRTKKKIKIDVVRLGMLIKYKIRKHVPRKKNTNKKKNEKKKNMTNFCHIFS